MPEPPHHLGEVLHLRGGHRRHAEGAVHGRDAAADAEGEASLRQPVHGGGPRAGDQRVAGVVIGCGGGDLHAAGHRARRADQRRRLLDVPPLGDERRAEAQFLAAAGLVHQARRALAARAGQQVVAEFVQHAGVRPPGSFPCRFAPAHRIAQLHTPSSYPQFQTFTIRPSMTRNTSMPAALTSLSPAECRPRLAPRGQGIRLHA